MLGSHLVQEGDRRAGARLQSVIGLCFKLISASIFPPSARSRDFEGTKLGSGVTRDSEDLGETDCLAGGQEVL